MDPTPEQIAKLPKWAKEHLTKLERRALEAESELRDEPTPLRDLPPPNHHDKELSKGWDVNHYRGVSGGVYKACSSSIHHGEGWAKTTTQKPAHLFSTELLATQALRAHFVKEYREKLAALDKRIHQLKQQA